MSEDSCLHGNLHDWRSLETRTAYDYRGETDPPVEIRVITWYCTRCRKIEETETPTGPRHIA